MLFIKRIKPVIKALLLLGAVGTLMVGGFFIFLDYQELKELDLKSIYGDNGNDVGAVYYKQDDHKVASLITIDEIEASPKKFQLISFKLNIDNINPALFSTVKWGVDITPLLYVTERAVAETFLTDHGFNLNKPIVVQCSAGHRSYTVVQFLRKVGLEAYFLLVKKEALSSKPGIVYIRRISYSPEEQYLYIIFDETQLDAFITNLDVQSRSNIFFVEGKPGLGKGLKKYGLTHRLLAEDSVKSDRYFLVSDNFYHLGYLRWQTESSGLNLYYFEEGNRLSIDKPWMFKLSTPYKKMLSKQVFRFHGERILSYIGHLDSGYYCWSKILDVELFYILDQQFYIKEEVAFLPSGVWKRTIFKEGNRITQFYKNSRLTDVTTYFDDRSDYHSIFSIPMVIKELIYRGETVIKLKMMDFGSLNSLEVTAKIEINHGHQQPFYTAEVVVDGVYKFVWVLEDTFPYKVTKMSVYRAGSEGVPGYLLVNEFNITEDLIARKKVPEMYSKGVFPFEKN